MTPPRWILLVVCALLPTLSWHLGGASVWYSAVLGFGVAAALAAWALAQDGQLGAALTPRAGDASLGIVPAVVLYALLYVVVTKVMAPLPLLRVCTVDGPLVPRGGLHGLAALTEWMRVRSCLAVGHVGAIQGTARVGLVLTVAALEELAWRGGVQQGLSERFGSTRGWLLASGLYALVHVGTLNAATVLVALPCGLLWGALYRFRGRLAPALLSHIVFSWALFVPNRASLFITP